MTLRKILLAGTALGAAALIAGPAFAGSAATTQAEIDALKQQMQELQQKLDDMQIQTSDALTDIRSTVTMPNGHPTFRTLDGAFEASIGGRLQMDAAAIDDNGGKVVAGSNGVELRRGRVNVAGKMFTTWRYKIEVDFAKGTGNNVEMKDVILEHDTPFLANSVIRAGNQYEPFGIENVTSDNFNVFTEFSLPENVMWPERSPGLVAVWTNNQNMGIQGGAFANGDGTSNGGAAHDFSAKSNGHHSTNWAATGRIYFDPIADSGSNTFVHVGGDVSYRDLESTALKGASGTNCTGSMGTLQSYGTQPESHLFANTLAARSCAEHELRYGPEFTANFGPANIQAEWDWMTIKQRFGMPDAKINGGYVQGSYFIYGGSRNYDVKSGLYGRPNIDDTALQLALRWSRLNMSDSNLTPAGSGLKDLRGTGNDYTIGANYYFNPNVRLMLNYVYAKDDYLSSSVPDQNYKILETRLQLDW